MHKQFAISANEPGSISIIIPCFNESKRLNTNAFRNFLQAHPEFRFVFVDDGSTDTTYAVLENMRNSLEHCISVIRLEQNAGKAEAVRQGILRSLQFGSAKLVGFWDADLATPLEALPDLVSAITESPGVEIIFGARVQLLGRQVNRKPIRHYLGRIFATITSLVLRMPFYDTQCGAKLFKITTATETIFSDRFLSKWVFDVEIIARYLRHYDFNREHLTGTIVEYPLKKWSDIGGSKVRPLDFFIAMRDIWRIKRTYLNAMANENPKRKINEARPLSDGADHTPVAEPAATNTPDEPLLAQKKSAT